MAPLSATAMWSTLNHLRHPFFTFSNQLGDGLSCRAFAVTLAIGVMVSMFSAIMVSRTILRVIAASTRLSRLLGRIRFRRGASELPQQAALTAVQRELENWIS